MTNARGPHPHSESINLISLLAKKRKRRQTHINLIGKYLPFIFFMMSIKSRLSSGLPRWIINAEKVGEILKKESFVPPLCLKERGVLFMNINPAVFTYRLF